MARKIVNKNSPGDDQHFAADDWDYSNKLLTGVDQSATDPVHMNTDWYFRSGRARFYVPNYPTNTFYYSIVAQQITANQILNLPLITGTDEFAVLNLAQIFSNKTYNLGANTLTDTGASVGGIPRHNGTKYVNQNIGTPGQVPTVNAGGTDWTWAAPTSTATIADDSVTTAKILNLAVTNAKLAGSISGDKILDNAITNAKLQQITDKAKLPSDTVYDADLTGEFVRSPSIKKQGFLIPCSATAATNFSGLLGGAVATAAGGMSLPNYNSTTGQAFQMTSSGGAYIGWEHAKLMFSRNQNCYFAQKFEISRTDILLFMGFINTGATAVGDDPLSARHGIMLHKTAAGSTYRIASNDGSGSTTFVDTGINVDTGVHTVIIKAVGASNKFQWSFDGSALADITTNIPASTTDMRVESYVDPGATATNFNSYWADTSNDV